MEDHRQKHLSVTIKHAQGAISDGLYLEQHRFSLECDD